MHLTEQKRARKEKLGQVSAAFFHVADLYMAALQDEQQIFRAASPDKDGNGDCPHSRLDIKAVNELAHGLFYITECIRAAGDCKSTKEKLEEKLLRTKIEQERRKYHKEEAAETNIIEIGAVQRTQWE